MSEEGSSSTPAEHLRRQREALREAGFAATIDARWTVWRPLIDLPMLALFIIVMTVLIAPPGHGVHPEPEIGSVAPSEIRADRGVLIEDRAATELRRKATVADVRLVFDYDSDFYFTLGDKVFGAVSAMQRRYKEATLAPPARREAFEADLGAAVSAGAFELIETMADPLDIAVAVNFFLNIALDRMVVSDRNTLPQDGAILVRDMTLDQEMPIYHLGAILDVRQVRRLMQARAGGAPYGSARVLRTWVVGTAIALAQPNLRLNEQATASAREAAVAGIEPVFVRIDAGEILVRRGDRVSEQIQERVRMLNQSAGARTLWGETAAVALLLLGVVLLAGFFFRRGRVPQVLDRRQTYLALTVVLVAALFNVAMYYAGLGLANGLGFDLDTAAYFVPLALATALVSMLVDARTSLLVGIGLTLLTAYRVDGDLWLVTYYIVGVLVAGSVARSCQRRTDLLRAGLAVTAAQSALLPIVIVLSGDMIGPQHAPFFVAACVSGMLVAVAALGLLPVLEHVFDQATDMRLLELASADHPILKRLALVAPGSYYASVVVGNLAEAAADAVGANGLKCRVMALYHDIGKMERPAYFSENQRDENPHNRLPPESSARIVFDHVLDGLTLGRRERLGRVVLEAISQHQGTTLLRSFYAKALEQEGVARNAVREEDYRYPGPKPLSREAGILLLADSVEAAARAMGSPDPAEVRRKTGQIIGEKVADGQLDDCDLTLRDLAAIEGAFARTLTLGVFHNRVEYPTLPRTQSEPEEENAKRGIIHHLRGMAR